MTGCVQDADGIDPAAGIPAALARFVEADRALLRCRRARSLPALLMMGIHEAILDDLETRGWRGADATLTLSKPRKFRAALTRWLLRPAWRPST